MRYYLLFLLLVLQSLDGISQAKVESQNNTKHYTLGTVVLDAGHGGHDPGCHGKSVQEKDIALAIILQLGHYIEENFPDIQVIYTRKTDVFVKLRERASIANRNTADLFISVHCNSSSSSAPYGTETFVMGLHKTAQNLEVAKRENSVILMENDYRDKYEYDPNSPVAHIMFNLYQNAFLSQSMLLATSIEDQFKNRVKRSSRGVKQAGFWVLYRTAMPSVLIETGFLSNPKEETFLASANGQDLIASAIFRSFREYKDKMEDNNVEAPSGEDSSNTEINHADDTDNATDSIKANMAQIELRVQILASYKPIDLDKAPYNQLEGVFEEKYENGLLRYYYGHFKTTDEARNGLSLAKQAGFSDAFIIGIVEGERKSFQEVLHYF